MVRLGLFYTLLWQHTYLVEQQLARTPVLAEILLETEPRGSRETLQLVKVYVSNQPVTIILWLTYSCVL
jgi:hypothetical protein